MTPDELRQHGEAMYGPRWQTETARAAGVAPRRLREWMAGTRPIPPRAEAAIKEAARRRASNLLDLLRAGDGVAYG